MVFDLAHFFILNNLKKHFTSSRNVIQYPHPIFEPENTNNRNLFYNAHYFFAL